MIDPEEDDGMRHSGLLPSREEMAEAAEQHRQAQRLAKAEAAAKAHREALEKILKAFANQGASAVFTMANIARAALTPERAPDGKSEARQLTSREASEALAEAEDELVRAIQREEALR